MAVNPLLVGGGIVTTVAVVGGGLYAGGIFSGSNTKETGPRENKPTPKDRGPVWIAASEDNNADSAYAANKYAEKYKRFLVGVNPKNDASSNARNNDAWWNWSFTNRYSKTTPKTGKGFASNITDETSLKTTCQKAYKGTLDSNNTEISGEGSDSSTKYPVDEVWKFCSPSEIKIKSLKEMETEKNGFTDGSYAKTTTYEDNLVSVKDPGADWFWELKEEELLSATTDPTADGKTGSEFKKLWNSKKGQYSKEAPTRLVRDKCKEAYNETPSSSEDANTKYPKADVGKFCSLSGQALS